MAFRDPRTAHLLRRVGFGGTLDDLNYYAQQDLVAAVDFLVNYEQIPDDVDEKIGRPGYASVRPTGGTTTPTFSPNTVLNDARQRWLFRMVHSQRWLEEKMTLFWHNHFATGQRKIASVLGDTHATRVMAAKPSEDAGGVRGQIELFREHATGNFRSLLTEVASDVAMLVWLDGRKNFKEKPQENFGRELMELFTLGVKFYTESDVAPAARAFTGWNLVRVSVDNGSSMEDPATHWQFFYNPRQHDTGSKTFSFPIYPDGSRTIPAHPAAQGMQDGLDLIAALARHPETARRLARKLYGYFVKDIAKPDEAFVDQIASVYLQNDCQMKPVLSVLFKSPQFWDAGNVVAHYSWPVEFVVRALKEVGCAGFTLADALSPLTNMGQQLYEPPSVEGWHLGQAWFSPGAMLARMNFATQLARNQRTNLAGLFLHGGRQTLEVLASQMLERMTPNFSPEIQAELLSYMRAGATWSASQWESRLRTKLPGLVRLVVASPEYQFA